MEVIILKTLVLVFQQDWIHDVQILLIVHQDLINHFDYLSNEEATEEAWIAGWQGEFQITHDCGDVVVVWIAKVFKQDFAKFSLTDHVVWGIGFEDLEYWFQLICLSLHNVISSLIEDIVDVLVTLIVVYRRSEAHA